MSLHISCKNRTLLVKVAGEIDLVTAPDFRESIDNAMKEMMGINLLVDMSQVSFIDSSGVAVILGRFRRIQDQGGLMILYGMNANTKRILDLSGILSFIPFSTTEAEAWHIIKKKSVKEA